MEQPERDVYELLDLGFGRCRMVRRDARGRRPGRPRRCAGSASCASRRSTRASRRATSSDTGRQAEIVEVKGSVELAPLTGLVEAIVDLTATGTTLRENGLVVREEIARLHGAADRQPGRAQAQGRRRSTTSWSGVRWRDERLALRRPARRRRASARSAARADVAADGRGDRRRRARRRRRRASRELRARVRPAGRARRRCASTADELDARARPRSTRPCAPALELGDRERAARSRRGRAARRRRRRAAAGPDASRCARCPVAPRGGLRARRARAVPVARS